MKRLTLSVVVVLWGAGQVEGKVVVWEVANGGNGHAYEFVNDVVLWEDARLAAELRHPPGIPTFQTGHLVSISDDRENSFLSNTFQPDAVWIGFTDDLIEGVWSWIDGTPGIWQDPHNFPTNPIQTAYVNWRNPEPNNFGGNEDYGLMDIHFDGTWNDGTGSTSVPFYYIIEYERQGAPDPFILTSLASGDWSTASTWNGGNRTPTPQDHVVIERHVVTAAGNTVAKSLTISESEATVIVGDGVTLDLVEQCTLATGSRLQMGVGGSSTGRVNVSGYLFIRPGSELQLRVNGAQLSKQVPTRSSPRINSVVHSPPPPASAATSSTAPTSTDYTTATRR